MPQLLEQLQVEFRDDLLCKIFAPGKLHLGSDDFSKIALSSHTVPKPAVGQLATMNLPDPVQHFIGTVREIFTNPILEDFAYVAI